MSEKEEITKILYTNSHDSSEGLVIRFENIQKVIEQIERLKSSASTEEVNKKPESFFDINLFPKPVNIFSPKEEEKKEGPLKIDKEMYNDNCR